MWDDAKQLNAVAAVLALAAGLALAWGAIAWALRQPAFAFREVAVHGTLERASAAPSASAAAMMFNCFASSHMRAPQNFHAQLAEREPCLLRRHRHQRVAGHPR